MTRPSPELLAVSRRWFDAIVNKRLDELRNFLSECDHLRFVGTADDELWSGAAVREGIAGFFGVIPDCLECEETFAEAYENGDTGWSCFSQKWTLANQPDRPFTVRTTLIFALEGGAWKIVKRHASVPFPNMEFTGTEQTAIADLVAAAQQGFALDQRVGFASVMFTDIVNSTVLATAMGDRAWSAVIADHFATIRETVEIHNGQFVKSLGDGTLSSFPSARAALAAARAVQATLARQEGEPRLSLRIGIHTGDVVQSDDDFFGSVVNKAARITAQAGAGEICVSDVTRAMVGEDVAFAFTDPAPLSLRGLDGVHLVHRLDWSA